MNNLAPLSPRDIADECRHQARLPTTPNTAAIVLLLAAKFLEQALDRNVTLAALLEQTEAGF